MSKFGGREPSEGNGRPPHTCAAYLGSASMLTSVRVRGSHVGGPLDVCEDADDGGVVRPPYRSADPSTGHRVRAIAGLQPCCAVDASRAAFQPAGVGSWIRRNRPNLSTFRCHRR